MSYPRKIHSLIVEDESDKREEYRDMFVELAKIHPLIIPPTFSISYEDACERIASSSIFHLVVLDLGLPYKSRQEAKPGVEPGIELVQRFAARDRYPVPALLVVSGRLGLAHQTELLDQISRGFFYGRAIVKSIENLRDVDHALTALEAYTAVGLHIQDSGNRWVPTLSPREEDMLRRCAVERTAIGVDVGWWSFEHRSSRVPEGPENGPTKVLMGRFLLDDNQASSRACFFKFEPAANAPNTFRNAAILDEKLRHVKVCHKNAHQSRSLLVTQSVSEGAPMPLDGYLLSPQIQRVEDLRLIASEISSQLLLLGTIEEEMVQVADVFWSYLELEKIQLAWSAYGGPSIEPVLEKQPPALFKRLKACRNSMWAKFKTGNHGDLNASNVALEHTGVEPHSWIFDAGYVQRDLALRDMAYLEATSLMFAAQSARPEVPVASDLVYRETFLPADDFGNLGISAIASNMARFICELRRAAVVDAADQRLYALLVFDAALRQLFGLAVAPKRNKILDPSFAVLYSARVAAWLIRMAPDWCEV